MAAVGMLMLGAFIGFVITYSFGAIKEWTNPTNIMSGAISGAVAGGVFAFIKFAGGVQLGDALFYYPIGLAWGALITALRWVADPKANKTYANLNIGAVFVATLFVALLLFWPLFRASVNSITTKVG